MKRLESLNGEKFQELSCAELSEIKGGQVSRTVTSGPYIHDPTRDYPGGYTYYVNQDQVAPSIWFVRTGSWADSGAAYETGCADNCNQQ